MAFLAKHTRWADVEDSSNVQEATCGDRRGRTHCRTLSDNSEHSLASLETQSDAHESDISSSSVASGMESHDLPNFAPSSAELDTQAKQLRAQAQEIEEAAHLARCKARDLQAASLQNSEPSVTQLDSQAAQLKAQAEEAQRAVILAQNKLHALRAAHSASVQVSALSPTMVDTQAAVPLQVAAPTQQMTFVAMVPCMPMFPMAAYAPVPMQPPGVFQQEEEYYCPPFATETRSPQKPADFTTLMLRNIPNSYSRNTLLDLLDKEGFQGCYDLVFVPVDFHNLAGLGYGFVNFTSHENAESAKEHFKGFDRWEVESLKVCKVDWSSPLQGLAAHIEHYRNSAVMHKSVPECHKPALFKDGVRQAFPSPTKQIRAPLPNRRKQL